MLSFYDLQNNCKRNTDTYKELRLAILADNPSQLLHTAIRGAGIAEEIDITIFEADYNQIDYQVYNLDSRLYEFRPQFVFINLSVEKLLNSFSVLDHTRQSNFSDDLLKKVEGYIDFMSSGLETTVIFNTIPELNDAVYGNFGSKTDLSFIYQIRRFNLCLMEFGRRNSMVSILDLALLQSQLGRSFTIDPGIYYHSGMVYSIDFLPYIAKHCVDILLSYIGKFKKCLILDLDNTLWGGVIGDDGMEGIQIGDLGMGKVFTEIQQWAKQLKERGILLAVCSKNVEAVAMEPFLDHPDMVLRPEDIATFQINWNNKVDNILAIQRSLNIAPDSMVFIDDNKFEREMVRSAIPGLCIPELPAEPEEYLSYLRSLNLFETSSITEEDASRTRKYHEEHDRAGAAQKYATEDDFLKSLKMQVTITPVDGFNSPRVAQLTQRSNQFNLRTVRYTEDELKKIAASGEFECLAYQLEDKFGSQGLVCTVIMKKSVEKKELFIDTWIMSCRVLKRGMEAYVMNSIVDFSRKNGFKNILGEYLATKKNEIVKEHYRTLGFEADGDIWRLSVEDYRPLNNFIH